MNQMGSNCIIIGIHKQGSDNKIIIMQELYQLIKQRFEKLDLLIQGKLTNDQQRELRQQQKIRCEKQAWIFSMFRSKKNNISTTAKSNYYKYCYEIMRVIDTEFTFDAEPNLSDETFLNDFVCLFTKFFDTYEDKFQFKVKIRNLLRPTNHNIIHDLIKYLADFSRDYSQHVYLWQLKSVRKQEEQEQSQQNLKRLSMGNHNVSSVIYSSQSTSTPSNLIDGKDKPLQSFRNSVNIGQSGLRKYNQDAEVQLTLRKAQFMKIYGVLQIQPMPNSMYSDKSKLNVDVVRLRMNQLYRDTKYRNNMIKSQTALYYNTYHSKFNPALVNNNTNKQSLIEDAHPHISHPYRVHLVIQKNGFSCINVTTGQQRLVTKDDRNLSPIKDKFRLSSLSNTHNYRQHVAPTATSKAARNNDFVLNSLKVLRVSQNFLPPLFSKKQTNRINSQEESTRKQTQNTAKKLSYSNTQNMININMSPKQQQIQTAQNGVIYYNQQLLRQAERRKLQKRRLSEMRKHFTSEQKNKNHKKSDPEEKIVEWLDKINMMKQLERKKIMGLG